MSLTYTDTSYEHYKNTGDQNHFEELIDAMVLDGIAGMNPTFKDAINGLSRDKKRMTILSLLDKDLNLFKRIKALTNQNINKMDHIKDIILMLREYVKVGEVEKKKFGEVMTPLELVKEMIATLPEEVWSNPNLKWLDPANGTGPYPIMVIYKLMVGLKEWEPDDEKRYKHIVENMIYVCELQPKNMFLYMCAVDPFDTYKLNIYTGSFLDDAFDKHMKDVWDVDKFDIVVGNPPYNTGSSNKGSSHVLWDKFVMKSIKNLSTDGYLVMVHPSGWRSISGGFTDVKNEILKRDLIYLEIHDERNGLKTFGAETRFDFYCLKNRFSNNFETKIKCQTGELINIDIKNIRFIPNFMFNELKSLLANEGDEKVKILYDCSYHHQKNYVSSEKNDIYKYPCIYTVKNGGELRLKYSSRNDRGHYGIPKLVWSNGRIISVGSFVDRKGDYALNQFSYAIVDDVENLDNIKKAFDSNNFRRIMEACSVANMSIDRKIIATFKKDFWKKFI